MPQLIAKKSLRYAGQSLEVGDKFEASEKDARLLKAVGRAGEPEDAGVSHEAAGTAYDQLAGAHESQGRKGKYQTRRLKAADGAKDATEE